MDRPFIHNERRRSLQSGLRIYKEHKLSRSSERWLTFNLQRIDEIRRQRLICLSMILLNPARIA